MFVGDPTLADAILDRLNNAHRITLKGGSMRRLYDSTKEVHHPRQPRLIHSCPAPPFRIPAPNRTAWPETGGRLRSERMDELVGLGKRTPNAEVEVGVILPYS